MWIKQMRENGSENNFQLKLFIQIFKENIHQVWIFMSFLIDDLTTT